MQTTMWCTRSVFSTATRTGAGPVDAELARGGARRRRAGAPVRRVDPARATTPRPVGRRPRHEPSIPSRTSSWAMTPSRPAAPRARGRARRPAARRRRRSARGRGRGRGRVAHAPPGASARRRRPTAGRRRGRGSRATCRAGRSPRGTAAARAARRRRRRASRGCGRPAWTRSTVPVLPLRYAGVRWWPSCSRASTRTRWPGAIAHAAEPRVELAGREHALLGQPRLDREQPALVVGRALVVVGRHALDAAAQLVDVHEAAPASAPMSASVRSSQSASSCSLRSMAASVGHPPRS